MLTYIDSNENSLFSLNYKSLDYERKLRSYFIQNFTQRRLGLFNFRICRVFGYCVTNVFEEIKNGFVKERNMTDLFQLILKVATKEAIALQVWWIWLRIFCQTSSFCSEIYKHRTTCVIIQLWASIAKPYSFWRLMSCRLRIISK